VKGIKEKRSTANNITDKGQAYETKLNGNIDKIAGRFCIVSQISKAREIFKLQEYQTTFWNQYPFKRSFHSWYIIPHFCKRASLG